MKEHREQFTAVPVYDLLKLAELLAILRLGVAERRDQQGDAVFGRGVERRIPDLMDQLPKSRGAKVEDCTREINRRVVVHQPSRHHPEQRLGDGELAAVSYT